MITGGSGFDTVNNTAVELSPVVLFLSVTVKPPAARVACPDTDVLLPPALMLHGDGVHPGPPNETVELEGSKFDPVNVIVKGCPVSGKFGEVLT